MRSNFKIDFWSDMKVFGANMFGFWGILGDLNFQRSLFLQKTKKWLNEVKTYSINDAKWKHAKKWCDNNDMEFKILTEDELGIRYK